MELNENDIAQIDRYLEGALSGDELSAFEARLADPEFASEVDLMRDLSVGSAAAGRAQLKADFAAAGAAVAAAGGLKDYSPSQNAPAAKQPPPKKSGGSGIVGKLLLLAFLGAAGYGSWLWFNDDFPPQWLKEYLPIEEPQQETPAAPTTQQPAPTQNTRTVTRDTVYYDQHGNEITKEQMRQLQQQGAETTVTSDTLGQ